MKYEIIVQATSEFAYTVEAESPDAATKKLQEAIDDGQDGDFPSRVYDTGRLEIIGRNYS